MFTLLKVLEAESSNNMASALARTLWLRHLVAGGIMVRMHVRRKAHRVRQEARVDSGISLAPLQQLTQSPTELP